MCKKQTSVSYNFKESEIISLDAGLRMDGLFALNFWDAAIKVLHSTNNTASDEFLDVLLQSAMSKGAQEVSFSEGSRWRNQNQCFQQRRNPST